MAKSKAYFVIFIGAFDGSSTEVQLRADGEGVFTFQLLGSGQQDAIKALRRHQQERIPYESLDAFVAGMRASNVLPRRVR